jgi:hypothetical protein
MMYQVDSLPQESVRLVQPATRENDLHARTEVTIVSSAQDPLQEVRPTTASIIAIPRSTSIEPSKQDRNSPHSQADLETAPSSPNVLVYSIDSSSSGTNGWDVSIEFANQSHGPTDPEVNLHTSIILVPYRLTLSAE